MKENGFTLKKKARSRRRPTETITDADYVDYLALLANTPAQAKSLLAVMSIDLYENSDKTEFMCYNQDGAFSSLNG